jgi:hypothetical protein
VPPPQTARGLCKCATQALCMASSLITHHGLLVPAHQSHSALEMRDLPQFGAELVIGGSNRLARHDLPRHRQSARRLRAPQMRRRCAKAPSTRRCAEAPSTSYMGTTTAAREGGQHRERGEAAGGQGPRWRRQRKGSCSAKKYGYRDSRPVHAEIRGACSTRQPDSRIAEFVAKTKTPKPGGPA